ncbi:hypothetical protein VIBC2010_02266 [Vibrio caribbeanicus ATCC BAA-2122]|uniref:Uncharacterized protein n=1 Tax=Vibrio caribbeanicus ATCC BAA-2122 TaxID=796620 RepID=E3BF57_9VIBR|nr:hypothetical protein VIBC2010_02266 [Vibrio caribbeanicus ATCC BAA-2122]
MGTHNEIPNLFKFVDYNLSMLNSLKEQSSIYTLKMGQNRPFNVQFVATRLLVAIFTPKVAQKTTNRKNWRRLYL